MFKDGVEKKLIMVRISHGPIPVTVASGKEIMASGEWGTLIPLADNSFQAVRALSMEKVVRRMPDYKLRLVLAEIKKGANCCRVRISRPSLVERLRFYSTFCI